ASELQVFVRVILPSSIPGMVSSALIALGFAFMVIVTAEMVGSRSGLGYLISQGRQLQATGQIFVGIIVLGFAGLVLDRVATRVATAALGRYGVKPWARPAPARRQRCCRWRRCWSALFCGRWRPASS